MGKEGGRGGVVWGRGGGSRRGKREGERRGGWGGGREWGRSIGWVGCVGRGGGVVGGV